MMPRPSNRRAPPFARAWAGLLFTSLSTSGCGGAAQGAAVDLGPPTPRLPSSAKEIAAPSSGATEALDLSISFHPGFTDHLGWTRLESPLSLQYLGSPGAKIQQFDTDWERTKDDEVALRIFEMELGRVDWPNTSVLLDEGHLCSAQLRDAVVKANPSRLLFRIDGGLGTAGVACLAELPPARLYLAGCLYRSHRADDRCDGDAEIGALAANERVRARVGGLALSLSTRDALVRLRQFPALTYLAIASGRTPAPDASFDALPFDSLPALRYLDISSWGDEQRVWGRPEARSFLGQLHTLRWHGEIATPVGPCQLRRLSTGRLDDAQLGAFASCTQLVELSTDGTDLSAAAALAGFARLERLHLRHFRAEDLSPIAKLGALRELSIPAGKASAFGFIAQLPELRVVDLSQTGLSDLSPFARLEHLEQLDVGFTKVADLGPITHLDTLVELELHQTRVVDLAPLAGLRRLKKLSISETAVSDLSPLAAHPALEWFVLRSSNVRDAAALLTMPSLKRAHIGGLSLPPPQVAALKQRLGYQLDGAP